LCCIVCIRCIVLEGVCLLRTEPAEVVDDAFETRVDGFDKGDVAVESGLDGFLFVEALEDDVDLVIELIEFVIELFNRKHFLICVDKKIIYLLRFGLVLRYALRFCGR
jgi:hypothetical protein